MDITVEEITSRLQDLPVEIYKREIRCNILREKADLAQLDFDREFAKEFQLAMASDLTAAEARQQATAKTADLKIALIKANSRLGAAQVKLHKVSNEFVSIRKQASIKNEEIFNERARR